MIFIFVSEVSLLLEIADTLVTKSYVVLYQSILKLKLILGL